MEYPYLIERDENVPEQDFTSYLLENREFLLAKVKDSGAILLRGFDIRTTKDFERSVQSLQPDLKAYVGGDSPRTQVTNHVYTSTIYPPEQTITLHNEMSYSNNFPSLIYFFCDIAPSDGGETPIADGRKIYQNLPTDIIDKFEQKKLKYIMNLHSGYGFGKSWQQVFNVETKDELETILNQRNLDYTFKANGLVQIEEIVNPIVTHPQTGEKVFFSQADQWHPSNLDEELRDSLKELMPEEDFYHHCRYADSTDICEQDLDDIRAVVSGEKVEFDWQQGDFLILDNILSLHGRNPFSGERRILVAMS